ncbi:MULTISPECIES: hypothetical protein [unclassified Sphingopyxis]|nr:MULTISPECIES: hypothetical protein [unclassified Sphingopyxis]
MSLFAVTTKQFEAAKVGLIAAAIMLGDNPAAAATNKNDARRAEPPWLR